MIIIYRNINNNTIHIFDSYLVADRKSSIKLPTMFRRNTSSKLPDSQASPSNKSTSSAEVISSSEASLPDRGSLVANAIIDTNFQTKVDATNVNKTMNHGGMNIKYAWVSQRGYYPDGTFVF